MKPQKHRSLCGMAGTIRIRRTIAQLVLAEPSSTWRARCRAKLYLALTSDMCEGICFIIACGALAWALT